MLNKILVIFKACLEANLSSKQNVPVFEATSYFLIHFNPAECELLPALPRKTIIITRLATELEKRFQVLPNGTSAALTSSPLAKTSPCCIMDLNQASSNPT